MIKCPRDDHRHRIEHFEIPRPEQISKARELGIHLAMQPAFDYFWDMTYYAKKLGIERASRKNAFRRLLDAGLMVGGGSDSMVTPMNPMLGVYSAVMNSNEKERISVKEALDLFLRNAARLSFDENALGCIRVGARADLAILERDPLEVEAEALAELKVAATVVQGEFLYRSPGFDA